MESPLFSAVAIVMLAVVATRHGSFHATPRWKAVMWLTQPVGSGMSVPSGYNGGRQMAPRRVNVRGRGTESEVSMRDESIARFWAKVDRSGDCWTWKGATWQGYGRLGINGRSMKAHRVSWEIANGPIPTGVEVCHRCDNPSCVRPDHLFLGTHAENIADMVSKGRVATGARSSARLHPERRPRGEFHPFHRLTAADVLAIRTRYAWGGITQAALASEYGVSEEHVRQIILRRKWAHL
jgi:hypothetical protein